MIWGTVSEYFTEAGDRDPELLLRLNKKPYIPRKNYAG
jgi:hypothetical protein